jgi:Zn-dependent peptidase ImmA (M78 family)/transcriptional regulator with XRE-family HTH domain
VNDVDPKAAAALFDRHQLTLARQNVGLKKTELAERIGKSAASITQFENGDARPSAAVLASLALALDFPLAFFMADANQWDDDVYSTVAFFRSLRSTSLSDRQKAVANARIYYRLSRTLEQFVDLPEVNIPIVPQLDLNADREQIEAAAAAVRTAWKIPNGPIGNVVRLLEANGLLVLRSELESNKVDAFSKRFPGRPVVVLGDDKADAARSRFDAAHELGHLILHADEDPGNARLERQANQFASAFLMPASEIRTELSPRVDWQRLAQLKRFWGVSMAALLYRSRDLGVLSPTAYQRAVAKMSALGWRNAEPAPLARSESPVLLATAMRVLEPDGYTLEQLGRDSRLPRTLLESALRSATRPHLQPVGEKIRAVHGV